MGSWVDIDDIILLDEEIMGDKLSKLDDQAMKEQNRAIARSRLFIPD